MASSEDASSSKGASSSEDASSEDASSSSLRVDDLDAATPLDLTYPDPFRVFRGCDPQPVASRLAPRALDLVADPSDPEWPVDCAGHETLCDVLRRVAVRREVLAAVANSQAPGIFEFVDGISRLGVKNFVVVALDDALDAKLRARGVASYRVRNDAVGSHKISAQKFGIVQEFVERGCSVLLTDTDACGSEPVPVPLPRQRHREHERRGTPPPRTGSSRRWTIRRRGRMGVGARARFASRRSTAACGW